MPKPNGQRIRKLRTDRGESQVELAARSGVSLRTLGTIESGTNAVPRKLTLRVIAEALGVPLEDIVERDAEVSEQAS
jgi:transcriptional regulator with XRE-family HTH domain